MKPDEEAHLQDFCELSNIIYECLSPSGHFFHTVCGQVLPSRCIGGDRCVVFCIRHRSASQESIGVKLQRRFAEDGKLNIASPRWRCLVKTHARREQQQTLEALLDVLRSGQ